MLSSATWLHALDMRRAGRVVEVPGGLAVLSSAFPAAHDHGKLSITSDVDGAVLAGVAEDVLGGEGLDHRLIEMRTTECRRAADGLVAAGWTRSDAVLMEWVGPGRPLVGGATVSELSLNQRVIAATEGWRAALPDAGADVCRQLGERITTVIPAAQTTFLGVVDASGRVNARVDLYEHDGRAQIEEVFTAPAARGQGFASLLVLEAVRRAGNQPVFLLADADDWPRRLYAKLGFGDVALLASFNRSASPVG